MFARPTEKNGSEREEEGRGTNLVIIANQVCLAHLEEDMIVDDRQVAMLGTSTDDGKALFSSFWDSQQTRIGTVCQASHVAHEVLQDQAVIGPKVNVYRPHLLHLRWRRITVLFLWRSGNNSLSCNSNNKIGRYCSMHEFCEAIWLSSEYNHTAMSHLYNNMSWHLTQLHST